ncbi:O-antigen ligase family protein, partial [Verrucomicrobiota bacterium]
ILMVLFLCFVAGAAFLLYKYLPFVQARVASGSAGRLELWPGVIEMIKECPAVGWGAWVFRYLFPAYKIGFANITWRYAHNEFLHIASETGLIGLGLTLLMIIVWYVRWILNYARSESWRTTVVSAIALAAVSASLVHALFDFNLTTYANGYVLLLIVGTAAGVEFAGLRKKERVLPKLGLAVNAIGGLGSLLLLGVTAVLFMNQLHMFIGNRQLYIARDYPAALESFENAEVWYDGYWRTYYHKGVAHRRLMKKPGTPVPEILSYRGRALADLTRCYELNPYFQAGVYELGELFEHRMDYDMQVALLKEVISLDPQRNFYWQHYFRRLRRMGATDEIKEACRLALQAGVLNQRQLYHLLRKEKIKGVDVKAIAKEVAANPQPVPLRIFRTDEQALTPLYSWEYAEDGSIKSWDHALLKK